MARFIFFWRRVRLRRSYLLHVRFLWMMRFPLPRTEKMVCQPPLGWWMIGVETMTITLCLGGTTVWICNAIIGIFVVILVMSFLKCFKNCCLSHIYFNGSTVTLVRCCLNKTISLYLLVICLQQTGDEWGNQNIRRTVLYHLFSNT